METTKTLSPFTVYAEMTPNPNTMKFVSNRWLITNDKSYEILANQRVGGPSPLAEKLFNFPFINGVFIAANFVTLTKSDIIEWQDVVMELRDFITNYLNDEDGIVIREEFLNPAKEEVVSDTSSENTVKPSENKIFTDFEQKIVEILDEYIKPAVESDGGAIELDSYNDGVVKVVLKGSCSGCPSSTMTLKAGIEQMLKNMLPEVQSVEAING
ncbi:MAG: NifU family protein [Flavobacteriales bacterium]|nr:NifU family protein [Flavobacteriales bacterium]MCW8913676.1 NifU family protein [Flavobacteriales bacterium]MCW8937848.1 NifU family protein [Flavobacteriales bacterium]MCW8941065.1 NifU family protein [Flavobacteriales bacterium]MCW8968348.1 NifU family protein [Flavobacteriales bacterium]